MRGMLQAAMERRTARELGSGSGDVDREENEDEEVDDVEVEEIAEEGRRVVRREKKGLAVSARKSRLLRARIYGRADAVVGGEGGVRVRWGRGCGCVRRGGHRGCRRGCHHHLLVRTL